MSGRPKQYDNLAQTSISIEYEVLERAKKEGINISEVCRNSLLDVINDPIMKKKYSKFSRIPDDTKKMVLRVIKKHPGNVRGCINIIKRQCGISVSAVEFLRWVDSTQEQEEG